MLIPLLVLFTSAAAENWPAWRGPDGRGISTDRGAPVRWSKTENVRWRIELPEPGNSTPIVWGNSIFVTQARKAAGERLLLCFDSATGKLMWEAAVPYSADEPTHPTNPYASASAVTDGERVIAWFGSAGLHAFDRNGKLLWKRDLGRQRHTWGYASSPLIHGDRLFLNFGPGDRAFLLALDKKTGKTLWQVDVPPGEGAAFNQWKPEDMYGSWSTPVLAGGELILMHPRRMAAYDPASGKVLWSSDGLGDLIYPSPVAAETAKGDHVIIAASGFQGPAMVVKPGGERLWHWPKTKAFIGSAVVKDGFLYWIDIGGVAQCVNVSNGEVMWTQRLPGAGEDNGRGLSPHQTAAQDRRDCGCQGRYRLHQCPWPRQERRPLLQRSL
ncbi:MAG: PQQ-like beta-propeller repeat protein [Acidobacteria bacterium]|nr:PQQ-like beta-propeller repeat protein [Acidobacteriota bacterium]